LIDKWAAAKMFAVQLPPLQQFGVHAIVYRDPTATAWEWLDV
jgi:hypothetical protein